MTIIIIYHSFANNLKKNTWLFSVLEKLHNKVSLFSLISYKILAYVFLCYFSFYFDMRLLLCCRIVSTYLVHHGYCATAEAFAKSTGQSFTEEMASIKNRQSES